MRTQISSKLPAILAIMILVGMVYAQPPDQAPPGGGQPGDGPRWNKERIETVIIGKFSSELNLTPEQAEKFFPRFKQLQNQVEEMQRGQRQRRDELDNLSQDPKADKSKVNDLVEQNSKDQEQMLHMKQDFLKDVSSFLTPQQISKCSILMDELPGRIRQFIEQRKEMHEGRGGPGGPHGPHGPRGGY